MSIATKTGDKGTSALMYGRRVPKTAPRVSAYGAVDELNSALGMVRAFVEDEFIAQPVFSIQKELVVLMGELAVADEDRARYEKDGYEFVTGKMVDRITALIDDLEKNHHLKFDHWATPGGTKGSALLDVARTTCRRAERRVVGLGEIGQHLNPEIIRYLNRLSDLCWLWARHTESP